MLCVLFKVWDTFPEPFPKLVLMAPCLRDAVCIGILSKNTPWPSRNRGFYRILR